MGIGTPTTAEKLTVNGYVQAVGYYYSSDRVLKENISSLTDALDMVENLR
ncbi:MAG: tail fiber domain-containing protein [Candidatus Peribacteria bacterium]|nr:MAG: tail fiber domain-containing protein [Candidatus Peribacteria bacterium]